MTGIKEIDQATQGFFTALPKHGVAEVSSDERKQQKTNYALIRSFINKKLESVPDGDTKTTIIENLNVATNAIDTMARHGAQFLPLSNFAGKTQEDQAINFYFKLKPILDDPKKLQEFTLAMGCVGASYKSSKNDIDFKKSIPLVYSELKEKRMK